MKGITRKLALPLGLGLLTGLTGLWGSVAWAQFRSPDVASAAPTAQRNALNLVANQVSLFQSATRTAASYSGNGYGQLLQQFQAVRDKWNGLKNTLSAQQLTSGANQVAELDSGLDIIQEAFTDYRTAVANGQSADSAFANMAQVLNEAMRAWLQELKQDCRQLQVGW